MPIAKPAGIERDPFRSAKWDEITASREFKQSDVPALTLLVQWYQVVDQCMEDISVGGGIQVAFSNDMGDIKALPQIATMKTASAEIRQLNKQLGIVDGRDVGEADDDEDSNPADVLRFVQASRNAKRAASG